VGERFVRRGNLGEMPFAATQPEIFWLYHAQIPDRAVALTTLPTFRPRCAWQESILGEGF